MINKVKNIYSIHGEYILNLVKSYFVTFINLVVMVFSTRYIVKAIGVEHYGLWILIQTVLGYVGVLHLGYISSFCTDFGRKVLYQSDSSGQSKYLNTYLFLFLSMCVAISLLTGLLVLFPDAILANPNDKALFVKTILLFLPGYLSIFLSNAYETILFYNFRMFNNRLLNEFISNSGQSLIFCLIIYLGFNSLPYLAVLYTCITLFISIKNFHLFFGKVSFKINWKAIDLQILKSNFRRSLAYWFMGISSVVLNQLDYLFIAKILNSNPLIVLYSQTSRIPQFFYNLSTKFTNNKSPKIVDLYSRGLLGQIKPVINNLFKVTLIFAGIGSLGFILLGKYVLVLWLGDLISFDQRLITIFGLILIPRASQWVFWTYFNNINEPKYNLYAGVLEITVNLVVSLALIQTYGLVGIALGSLVALTSSNLLLLYFYRRHKAVSKVSVSVESVN